ncbi:alpha,alpha-trehalase TreF [Nibrella viscosa]|uniref:Alpha,alpha-trehalase TreF n=1 Tax=Nibrella viscosa TaxID=1084524 RepID=A0ABP8KK87_9BACT
MTQTHQHLLTYMQTLGLLPPDQLYGLLFHDVQMQPVFTDSKTFADCFPRHSPEEILSHYEIEKCHEGFQLIDFIRTNFDIPVKAGKDFTGNPELATADHLHQMWDVLTFDAQPNSSLLPVPNRYIVPGGRFREFYYWDSYFTLLGLRVSGNTDLIRCIVDNCAFMIDFFGHVPNGNRNYYLSRSQPPCFALMLRLLTDIDGFDVLTKYLPHLQKEYVYWMDGHYRLDEAEPAFRRVVRLPDGTILNRYWDDNSAPRPESYREDVELAHEGAPYGIFPQDLYRHIRAACESGWDFSSRWCADPDKLVTIHTTDILPVDLNCLLYFLEKMLAIAYSRSPMSEATERFQRIAEERRQAICNYFWDEKRGFFMDYDAKAGQPTSTWSLAGLYPLLFGIATDEQARRVHEHICRDFLKTGGLVTTLHQSGQQWDSPNGWAPLQWIAHQGLLRYGYTETAAEIRKRWLALNDKVFKETGKMMEKYNVIDPDVPAGGGEYPNQDGFGWTNGVYLCLQTNDQLVEGADVVFEENTR